MDRVGTARAVPAGWPRRRPRAALHRRALCLRSPGRAFEGPDQRGGKGNDVAPGAPVIRPAPHTSRFSGTTRHWPCSQRSHACPRQHVHEPLPVAFCLMLIPLRDDHLACHDEFRHHSLPAGPCRSFQREQPSSPSPAAPRERGHLRSPTSPKCTTRGGRSVNTRGLYRLVRCVEFFFSRLPFVQCWKV